MKFAPEYVTNVLNEHFEDAKAFFLSPLMAIGSKALGQAQAVLEARAFSRCARTRKAGSAGGGAPAR